MANGTIAASQLEMLTQSGTGIITIVPPATNTNRTLTLPDATGTVVASGTTPSLNGIAFPATQVPSADANTLDDYEEGTWTPVLGSFTNTGGRTLTGRYTKIGNMVTIVVSISTGTQTLTSTANTSFISGLPFTVGSGSSYFAGVATNYLDTVNQGSLLYSGSIVIYTVAFTAASERAVNVSGTYFV